MVPINPFYLIRVNSVLNGIAVLNILVSSEKFSKPFNFYRSLLASFLSKLIK
jgi:hypothetical protein